MHFALPPRKTSNPPPYARTSTRRNASQRRQQLYYVSYSVLCILTLYLLYSWILPSSPAHGDGTIPEDSSILLVTVFDEQNMSEDYMTMIKTNRNHYAARHGYETFYTNTSTYKGLYGSSPSSWALIPALRNSLTLHPQIDYVWSLSADAIITNFTLDLHSHILKPLPKLILKDIPVVPPDSVIHTFSHLTPSSINLVITQDYDNLAETSFLLRNTLTIRQPPTKPRDTWTQFFLDAWFDPLYRAYAFQKAENHALEHIVQWHPTILAKLVLINQRRLNSYNFQYPTKDSDAGKARSIDSMWQPGDLVVNFKGCQESSQRDCEKEMRNYFDMWLWDVGRIDGKPVDVQLKVSKEEYVSRAKTKDKSMSEYESKRTHL